MPPRPKLSLVTGSHPKPYLWLQIILGDRSIPSQSRHVAHLMHQAAYHDADEDGWFPMLNGDLAARMGLSESAAREHLKWLVRAGLIEKNADRRGGRQVANLYRLSLGSDPW